MEKLLATVTRRLASYHLRRMVVVDKIGAEGEEPEGEVVLEGVVRKNLTLSKCLGGSMGYPHNTMLW
jgi:hypothetical protein